MVTEIFNIFILVEAIWLILPAYAANGLVPLLKGRHPVDGGRKLGKNHIFGPGKTWEGLLGGMAFGALIGLVEQLAFLYLPWDASPLPLTIIPMSATLGLLLGFGAITGDMAGSFIKRRLGMKPGALAPILDQDDFIVGALLFASILAAVKTEWWLMLLVITPLIHWVACIIGFLLKVKKTPY